MRLDYKTLGLAAGLLIAVPGLSQDQPAANSPAPEAGAVQPHHDHSDTAAPKVPELMVGYGNGGSAVSTQVPQAQAFFSNGMELAMAFAHKASIQAMGEAVRLDPACAMCRWGLAYTSGPTINYGADRTERAALFAMLETGQKLARKSGSEREKDLIKALRNRYRPGSTIEKRDGEYARDMVRLTVKYPDDNMIPVLAADAIIQAMTETTYKTEAMKAVGLLEVVLARAPNDTPAIHFYIHATEIAGVPARAESFADRLSALAPRASHQVHMPSHTYYWVGRYQDAATTNSRAVEIGKENAVRLAMPEPDGVWGLPYHSHNVIFGLGGALMAGDAKIGLELGRPLADRSEKREEGDPIDQLLASAGYFAIARFDDPAVVLARPEPKLEYLKAAWHYARGEVFARQGDLKGLHAEIDAIAVPDLTKSLAKPADQMVVIVRQVLIGRLAMAERRWEDAAAAFRLAAQTEETEDFMRFSDPPAFWYPVRRDLAAALVSAGDKAGALGEIDASLKLRPKDPVAMALREQITG